jgi:SMC interacting uncharacterized protein involved in chromosome segregation
MTREQNDIATTLRDWSVQAQLPETRESTVRMRAVNGLAIAADEIERLRAELVSKADELEKQYRWHHLATEAFAAEKEATLRELRKVETECSMLRVECGLLERNAETTYENHKRIVAELTAERDEARRSCCEYAAIVDGADTTEGMESGRFYEIAMNYMKDRGWDCFKEHKA